LDFLRSSEPEFFFFQPPLCCVIPFFFCTFWLKFHTITWSPISWCAFLTQWHQGVSLSSFFFFFFFSLFFSPHGTPVFHSFSWTFCPRRQNFQLLLCLPVNVFLPRLSRSFFFSLFPRPVLFSSLLSVFFFSFPPRNSPLPHPLRSPPPLSLCKTPFSTPTALSSFVEVPYDSYVPFSPVTALPCRNITSRFIYPSTQVPLFSLLI